MSWTYLLLNLLTIGYPLARSFEHRIRFASQWPYLLPAIAATAAVFIPWDIWFTQQGIWSFNPAYTLGPHIALLPLEEWLFFLTVPFACTFIYEVLIHFFPRSEPAGYFRRLNLLAIPVLVLVGLLFSDRLYTRIAFPGAALWLLLHQLTLPAVYQYRLWTAYGVSLLPFLLVNGVLTGLPVVRYNDAENLGLRLGSIPVDDFAYCLFLLGMTFTIYEWLRRRQATQPT